jgi:hypothetical protein
MYVCRLLSQCQTEVEQVRKNRAIRLNVECNNADRQNVDQITKSGHFNPLCILLTAPDSPPQVLEGSQRSIS